MLKADFNNNCRQKVSFGAKPVAKYTVEAIEQGQKALKELTVYEAEPKDRTIVQHMLRRISTGNILSEGMGLVHTVAHGVIMKKALLEADRLLEMQSKGSTELAHQAKILFAVADKQPVGLAIANNPKITSDNKITYSSRTRQNETELDWLTACPLPQKQKLKGAGKILLAHVFDLMQSLSVNNLYIRSEVPKHSIATEFYKSMGCHQIGSSISMDGLDLPVEISRPKNYKLYTGKIVPFEINKQEANQRAQAIFGKFKKENIDTTSKSPDSIVDYGVKDDKPSGFSAFIKKLAFKAYLKLNSI